MYKILANTLFLGKEVIYLPTCHSTNEVAQDLVSKTDKPEGSIVITDHQLNGKGQRGNIWQSEVGKNLTFSLILKPEFLKPEDQFYLNIVTSLAILHSLREVQADLQVQIKWPNDILIHKKKVCGILIENRLGGSVINSSIIGIGLNVNQQQIPYSTATSLHEVMGVEADKVLIFERIIHKVEYYYRMLKRGDKKELKKMYMENLYGYKTSVKFFSDSEFLGQIIDIDDQGRMMVTSQFGEQLFGFKEVLFVL